MRFIHIADVHLGARPDRRHFWSEQREEEIWQSFQRLISQVKLEKADLLLIAGDLFHTQPLYRDLREVNYLFERLGQTQVVLIMGNHDYISRDAAILDFAWSENVHCLMEEEAMSLHLEEINTYVYGLSYHTSMISQPLYDELHPLNSKGCHILLAHGGDAEHIPFDKKKLSMAGFDYIALGHIHKPEILIEDRMAYAGALEPIDCNDVGSHGYIRGEYEEGQMEIEFVPFAQRKYIHLEVNSHPNMTDYSLQEKVEEEIRSLGRENLYRITITGYRNPDINYHLPALKKLGNIVDIQDKTEPDIDIMALYRKHRDDVCGKFIAKLYTEKKVTSEIHKKALLYGIRAMLEEG